MDDKNEIKMQQIDSKEVGNRICHYLTKVWGEVRKVQDVVVKIHDDKKHTDTEYHHLDISCDDENGDRFFLQDKDMSHNKLYKRGTCGTFTLRVDVEDMYKGKTRITVVDFKEGE